MRDDSLREVASGEDCIDIAAPAGARRGPALVPGQIILPLKPGHYHVGIEARATNSKRRAVFKTDVNIPVYASSPCVSEIQFAADIRETEETRRFQKGTLQVVPHPLHAYRTPAPIVFYFEIYGLDTDEEGKAFYRVEYRIIPLEKKRWGPVLQDVPANVGSALETSGYGSTQPQRLSIATNELWEGPFRLDVTVTDRRTFKTAAQSAKFSIIKYRALRRGREDAASGSLFPAREVALLLLGELVDLHAHARELERGDHLVDLARHRIDLLLELRLPFTRCSTAGAWSAKLISMTIAGWPSAAARLISRPSPSRLIFRPSLRTYSSTNLAHRPRFLTESSRQGGDVDLDVEVARVGDDRAVLHLLEVLRADDDVSPVTVTKMSPDARGLEPIGMTLKPSITASSALSGIDLGDDHVRPHALGAHRHAAAAPAVAGDDERRARASRMFVARMIPSIVRLARAVAVVEEVLRVGVVDGDDRVHERRRSSAMLRSRMTPVVVSSVPAEDAGEELAALLWSTVTRSAPSSIVIVRLRVENGVDVAVVASCRPRP